MAAVWFNHSLTDEQERRRRLYAGEIFVYDHLRSVKELASFARQIVEEALVPHDPRFVHEKLAPMELAAILGRLKPTFTHHPKVRRLTVGILEELGCDLTDCHVDVAKLRTAYPSWHLRKGIAYAFPAHRDTWYGAPQAQINWWLPLYPLHEDNAMAFYPRYFSKPIENDSQSFNYYRRNIERQDVAKFVAEDPRVQPAAININQEEPEFRLLPSVGGLILFSGAQLHATVASSTCLSRYSIDFRTVSRHDVEQNIGAPKVDVRCSGTALRDFRRAKDNAPLPEETARMLDPVGPVEGEAAIFDYIPPNGP
jgi:hypothetical protein